MAGTGVIALCNGALSQLGGKFLSSTADLSNPSTTEETLCANGLRLACETVMRQGSWKCVQRRAALVETDAPAFGWNYAFMLPDGCVRINRILLEGREDYGDGWEEESGTILTDYSSVDLVYNYLPVEDFSSTHETVWNSYVGSMNGDLKNCIELALALLMCMPLTENATRQATLKQEYLQALADADMNQDRQSGGADAYPTGLLDVRW